MKKCRSSLNTGPWRESSGLSPSKETAMATKSFELFSDSVHFDKSMPEKLFVKP